METVNYLWKFIKNEFNDKEDALAEYSKWKSDADAHYEKVIELDLSKINPQVTIKGLKINRNHVVPT